MQEGKPFAGNSMTEDYELGLKLGALGHKTMFVRIPRSRESAGWLPPAATSRQPSATRSARKRAGSAASRSPAGTDSAGRAALGEHWMRMRDRRGPLAALLLLAAYLGRRCGRSCGWRKPRRAGARADGPDARPADGQRRPARLASADARLLSRRRPMGSSRDCFGAAADRRQCHRHAGRVRAVSLHVGGGARRWDKTRPHLPGGAAAMRPSLRSLAWRSSVGPACARQRSGSPGRRAVESGSKRGQAAPGRPLRRPSSRRSNRARCTACRRCAATMPPALPADAGRLSARSSPDRRSATLRESLPVQRRSTSRLIPTAAAILCAHSGAREWPLVEPASAGAPGEAVDGGDAAAQPCRAPPPQRLDRLQLSAWALLRAAQARSGPRRRLRPAASSAAARPARG